MNRPPSTARLDAVRAALGIPTSADIHRVVINGYQAGLKPADIGQMVGLTNEQVARLAARLRAAGHDLPRQTPAGRKRTRVEDDAYRSRSTTAQEVYDRIADADPGAEIIYWVGNLPRGCVAKGGSGDAAIGARNGARRSYKEGWCLLVQRRICDGNSQYLARRL